MRGRVIRHEQVSSGSTNIRSLAADMGISFGMMLKTDASARHINTQELWLQGAVRDQEMEVHEVDGRENVADILTKNGKADSNTHGSNGAHQERNSAARKSARRCEADQAAQTEAEADQCRPQHRQKRKQHCQKHRHQHAGSAAQQNRRRRRRRQKRKQQGTQRWRWALWQRRRHTIWRSCSTTQPLPARLTLVRNSRTTPSRLTAQLFGSLTYLRAATIQEIHMVFQLETQAVDASNAAHRKPLRGKVHVRHDERQGAISRKDELDERATDMRVVVGVDPTDVALTPLHVQ